MTLGRIQSLVQRGEVSRTHQLSTDGGNSWQPASMYPEVFELPPTPTAAEEREGTRMTELSPEPTSDTYSSADDSWYYADGESQSGPIGLRELKQLFRVGQLNGRTEVWTDSFGETWLEADDVPELAAVIPKARRKRTRARASGQHLAGALSNLVPVLKRLRFWTMFVAVYGLVMSAIQLISGIILIAFHDKGRVGLVLLFLFLIPAVLFWLLAWSSVRMTRFIESPSERHLLDALGMLRVFWTYSGVLVCLLIAAFVLGVAFSLATGQAAVMW